MDLRVLEEIGIGAVGGGVRAEPRQSGPGRFLHHVAELPGDRERARARHP